MTLSAEEFADKDDSLLLQEIKLQKWEAALQHLDQIRTPDVFGNLPLHAAIGFNAPDSFIFTLLEKYPEATRVHGTDDWLPLHIAAMWGRSSCAVVEALIKTYPQALDDAGQDSIKGRTPRHFAARSKHNRALLERSTKEWLDIIESEHQK